MQPTSDSSFPRGRSVTTLTRHSVIDTLSDALRRAAPGYAPAKQIAIRIGRKLMSTTDRAPRNWLQKRNAPDAVQLIALMSEFDEVYEAVIQLAGRKPISTLNPEEHRAIERALEKLCDRS